MANLKQRGYGFPEVMFAIVVAAAVYILAVDPYLKDQRFREMKSNYPEVTIDSKILVDSYSSKPEPKDHPRGRYEAEFQIDGKSVAVSYYFDDKNTVTKEMKIAGIPKISGSAQYQFNGSVLMFSEVIGDKALFPEIGEAIVVENPQTITMLASKKDGENIQLSRVEKH